MAPIPSSRRREAQGILLLTLGLFLLLSVVSLVFGDGSLMGPVGQWVATALYAGFGAGTLALSGGILLLAVRYLCGLPLRPSLRRTGVALGMSLTAAALLHLIGHWLGPGAGAARPLRGMPLGGALGEYVAEVLIGLVGTAGTLLLAGLGLLLSLLLLTELSLRRGLLAAASGLRRGLSWVAAQGRRALSRRDAAGPGAAGQSDALPAQRPVDAVPAVVADYGDDRDQRPQTGALALLGRVSMQARQQLGGQKAGAKAAAKTAPTSGKPAAPAVAAEKAGEAAPAPLIVQRRPASPPASPIGSAAASPKSSKPAEPSPAVAAAIAAVPEVVLAATAAAEVGPAAQAGEPDAAGEALRPAGKAAPRSPFGDEPSEAAEPLGGATDSDAPPAPAAEVRARGRTGAPAHRDPAAATAAQPVPELVGDELDKTISQSDDTSPIVLPPSESKTADEVAAAASLAENRQAAQAAQTAEKPHYKPLRTSYEPPPLSLFDFEEQKQLEIDRKAMLDLAQRLESTLADYLVKGRVTAIHPGPVVTMYEFVPAPGTKLSKITALSSDLAMALEALRVRIVAPIPGKAAGRHRGCQTAPARRSFSKRSWPTRCSCRPRAS